MWNYGDINYKYFCFHKVTVKNLTDILLFYLEHNIMFIKCDKGI